MPTVLRVGPYGFFFYSLDGAEPRHIHIRRDAQEAKFWLAPVRLARNRGFSDAELNRLAALAADHEPTLLRAWDDHFAPRS